MPGSEQRTGDQHEGDGGGDAATEPCAFSWPTTPSRIAALASPKQRSTSILNIRVSDLFLVSSSLASVVTMCEI
ncbi:hypothetical protein BHE74_00032939 [Ensete ventricosum]|nr:hypothetical protein BHE74_00032939 [Ensete ventricosum]